MMGHVDDKSVHIAGDYPELFGSLFEGHGIELVRYDLDEHRFPDDLRSCDGWLSSPSRLSTYDPVPWLPDAEDLLREIVAVEAPFVGICFGHQLLAQALGGAVEKSPYGWGLVCATLQSSLTDRGWGSAVMKTPPSPSSAVTRTR